MANWMEDRVGAAERGENPMVLARMRSGFAVIGDTQFLPGYCLLLAAPRVDHLSDLPMKPRTEFLLDMSLLGEAIEAACRSHGLVRVNYEILGNREPFLHAHVWPRYDWEPEEYRSGPVGRYGREYRTDEQYRYSDDDVMQGRACGYVGSSGDQGDLDFNKIVAHIQPGWGDHDPAPTAGGLQAIIPAAASPEQQEAAFKFLAFWTQPEMTAEWSVKTGYMPVRLSAIESPVLQEAAKKRPAILVPPKQLEVASPAFIDPTDGKINDALSKAADKVEIEGVPAEQALNEAAKEAQAALDRVLADKEAKSK